MPEHPKILVTSISGWNSRTGSDTFQNLFEHYGPEKLANIFIRADIPDSPVCGRYFRISESRVAKSIFFRNIATGFVCGRNSNVPEKENIAEKKRYGFFAKHRFWIFIYARELIWKLGKWKSKELDGFIDDFSPDVVLFPIEGCIHFNRINEYIVKKTGVKAVGFLWDDNFTYKTNPLSPGFYIHRFFLRKSVKRLAARCDVILSICPKMKEECGRELGIDSVVITKGIAGGTVFREPDIHIPLRLMYSGKLIIGRAQTLLKLVKAIRNVNAGKIKMRLDIYTDTPLKPSMRKKLDIPGCSRLMGYVPHDELARVQENADILVFAESLSGYHKYSARLSFSTKLTEYLGAGKCILAIGPKDISSMEYLAVNRAAAVACDKRDIEDRLKELLDDGQKISEYARRAYELGRRNHDAGVISEKLYAVLDNLM